ncbi:hypothetical protein MPSEU_000406600 [Mayamaea pseudoterrestris]|nr:hypothetical protein MPSEU_000406600 [Mayamaea pseudoterrestris]
MGTTESIFVDAEEDDVAGPSTRPRRPSAASSLQAAPASKTPPSIHSRRRQRPQSTLSDPVCRLNGIVFGLPKSGKRTLMNRLQGKDPFADSATKDLIEAAATNSSITAPYKASAQTWDRIELQVGLGLPENDAHAVDFAVLVVHPQQKRKHVKKHLKQSLKDLLKLQGYKTDNERHGDGDEHDDDATREATKTKQSKHTFTRPICLCVLINFRDLLGQDADEDELHEIVSDMTSVTMNVLQSYAALEPNRLVLMCGHVSLFNCFGLQRLHSFIYQAYLQRKQSDLEAMLQQVFTARRQVQALSQVSYTEYMESILPSLLQQNGQQPSSPSPRSIRHSQKTVATAQIASEDTDEPVQEGVSKPFARRQILPDKNQHIQQQQHQEQQQAVTKTDTYLGDSEAALEAFLADSDSETEDNSQHPLQRRNNDSDDEDDNDAMLHQVVSRKVPSPETAKDESTEGSSSSNEQIDEVALTENDSEDAVVEPAPAATERCEALDPSEAVAAGDAISTPPSETVESNALNALGRPDDALPEADETVGSQLRNNDHKIQTFDPVQDEIDEANETTTSISKTKVPDSPPKHAKAAHATVESLSNPDDDASTSSSDGGYFVEDSRLKHDFDSDDEDFMIETIVQAPAVAVETGLAVTGLIATQQDRAATTDSSNDVSASNGLSQEVLAALAVARQEAEAMLKVSDERAIKKVKKD